MYNKLTSIRDSQNGCQPIALTQGSKRDLIPPFNFLDIFTDWQTENIFEIFWESFLILVDGYVKMGSCQGANSFENFVYML